MTPQAPDRVAGEHAVKHKGMTKRCTIEGAQVSLHLAEHDADDAIELSPRGHVPQRPGNQACEELGGTGVFVRSTISAVRETTSASSLSLYLR